MTCISFPTHFDAPVQASVDTVMVIKQQQLYFCPHKLVNFENFWQLFQTDYTHYTQKCYVYLYTQYLMIQKFSCGLQASDLYLMQVLYSRHNLLAREHKRPLYQVHTWWHP